MKNDHQPPPERRIRITVPEEYVGTCIGIVNAGDGLVCETSQVPATKTILVVADVPLRTYAKVAAEIGDSTRGNAVVELIE